MNLYLVEVVYSKHKEKIIRLIEADNESQVRNRVFRYTNGDTNKYGITNIKIVACMNETGSIPGGSNDRVRFL